MIEYDFEKSIGYLLHMTALAMRHALQDELKVHGITFRQWQVLAAIVLLGEDASQAQIADLISMDEASLVGVLDRMERDGWLRRVVCPHDRRKRCIHPTPQVDPYWEKMVECAHRVRQQAARGIPKEDFQTAWRVLEQMQANLKRASARQQGAMSHASR